MRINKTLPVLLILGVLMLSKTGCSSHQPAMESTDSRVQVFVSLLPQAYFAEKVGGEHVQVSVLIPPGADPHTYEPTPQQMKDLAKADLYLKVGTIEFEEMWMDRIVDVNPGMLVVDTSQSIDLIDQDPHIWLSPNLARQQAQSIYQALITIDAAHQPDYQRNLQAFQGEMDQLDQYIKEQLKNIKHRELLVFHPAWRYFCADYGLEEIAIEQEGKEPTVQEMVRIINDAREKGIRAVIVSPQHSTHQAEAIAGDIGAEIITLDPLARDYTANLRQAADELARALSRD